MDTVRGHFYLEEDVVSTSTSGGERSSTRVKESRATNTRGDMNIFECGLDCTLCGPTHETITEKWCDAKRNGRRSSNSTGVASEEPADVVGGNLGELGWVCLDLNDPNLVNMETLNSIPETSWAKIFNTEGLEKSEAQPGFRQQCELRGAESKGLLSTRPNLQKIIKSVEERALPVVQKLVGYRVRAENPVLLRTQPWTDTQDPHRDWKRSALVPVEGRLEGLDNKKNVLKKCI